MTQLVRRRTTSVLAAALGAVLFVGTGVSAAVAGPRPIEPEFPPSPPVPPGPDRWEQLRWMLDGAGILLAITAVALAVVLWRRAHAAARRSVPA